MSEDNRFRLLDLPFPFQAALSICSDIDGTSWDDFLSIHKFLNSDKTTPLGNGLKLPVGDSFWFYDNPSYPNAAFSYFKPDKITPSEFAPQIRLLIRAGILDVMHSYGNFVSEDEFSRELAARALEEIDRHHLKIDVWTNHGGAESVQNIGAATLGKGDLPDENNRYYHSDLLIDFGVKFYWDSEQSLTPVVGQDRKASWADYFANNPLHFSRREKTKALLKGVLSFIPDFAKDILLRNRVIIPDKKSGNDLFEVDALRDNRKIFKIRRFGSGKHDWSDDLPKLLNDKVLEKLLRSRGKMIVYVHMGDRREKSDEFPLSQETVNRFKQIADLFHREILWVATTRQLLTFSLVKKYLTWTVEENEYHYLIKINGMKKAGIPFELSPKDLQGISFSLPDNKEGKLIFKGKELALKRSFLKKTNKQILTIPIDPIEWPL
ncbi:MAG: hypothetical protein GXO74_09010 [Calditrichaeota bacterium]|nr:hypothetical protein [Calditrichota bacterium]